MIDVVVLSCKLNNCVYYVSPNDIELSYNDICLTHYLLINFPKKISNFKYELK